MTNKYKAEKVEWQGTTYHSKKEQRYAFELEMRQKAGDIKSWERQIRIPIEVNGFHICNYYIDFVVHHNDDTTEYVEVKGFVTETWRLKWKLFEALYSDKNNVRLTVVQ